MCAYHTLFYHTPTDCPTMPTTTTTNSISNSIACCALLLSTRLVPYLQSIPFLSPPSLFSPIPAFYFPIPVIFLSSSYTFFVPLFRKLPWLSRQSDRLLTDRSLVRSQAEAPFLLFPYSLHIYETRQKSTPPVGLEPTTARLRAARSTDWARKATDDIPNMSLFYQYCPLHVRNTHSSWHLYI